MEWERGETPPGRVMAEPEDRWPPRAAARRSSRPWPPSPRRGRAGRTTADPEAGLDPARSPRALGPPAAPSSADPTPRRRPRGRSPPRPAPRPADTEGPGVRASAVLAPLYEADGEAHVRAHPPGPAPAQPPRRGQLPRRRPGAGRGPLGHRAARGRGGGRPRPVDRRPASASSTTSAR